MRARIAILLVLALAPWAVAVPPRRCTQRLRGVFQAEDGRLMAVSYRLHMRDDVGDLSFRGQLRCTSRHRDRCFLPDLVGGAVYLDRAFPSFEHRSTSFPLYRRNSPTPVCELQATTPYIRDLCIGAMGGTFTCTDVDGSSSVSGAFGLAADTCEPCLFDR